VNTITRQRPESGSKTSEKAAAAATKKPEPAARGPLSAQDRQTRIAEAAYRRAHARGFEAGGELEDWLTAEREVDAEHP
jgi:hypothetical protein